MTGKLLTAREVAERLGLSRETVLRKWRTGELPGFQLSTNVLRFDEAELERWLVARRRLNPRPSAAAVDRLLASLSLQAGRELGEGSGND
jgi:excisionase family DNA binding protein